MTTEGTAPTAAPIPIGFGVELDPDARRLDGATLFGGSPARIMRLTAAGQQVMEQLRRDGTVRTGAAGMLARRLTDANAAHPRPPQLTAAPEVTVIIPVKDRAAELGQCLTTLGGRYPVVVVDDGSLDPDGVAAVARAHHATLVVRRVNGGPAAARNSGFAVARTDLVAFVDSDCLPPSRWIEQLAAHLADPLVAAAAPRIVVHDEADPGGRFITANGSLDLGGRAARVVPASRVSYVPTAAIVMRRSALVEIGRGGGPFDETMRVGEDVDLIWRLHNAGWRVRYVPDVRVVHQGARTWTGLLGRRFFYGTSAALLAQRHPEAMTPLALHPWSALTVAALLGRRPVEAAVAFTYSVLSVHRSLTRVQVPPRGVVRAMGTAVYQTWLGLGRYTTQFFAPLLVAALVKPGGGPRRQRWGRRLALVSLLLGRPVTTWQEQQPNLDLVRFTLGRLADDISYGAGVWAGAARNRTGVPLRPTLIWHPLRIAKLRSRA